MIIFGKDCFVASDGKADRPIHVRPKPGIESNPLRSLRSALGYLMMPRWGNLVLP